MSSSPQVTEGRYAFSGAVDVDAQLVALQEMLDPVSRARFAELGIPEGARCWEVGAGGGSMARHLAELAGPGGTVVATDLDTGNVAVPESVRVLEHDVRKDPIPDGGGFDVIHARWVLMHLPERREVLARLVDALAPGGLLVLEEPFCATPNQVLAAPDPESADVFTRFIAGILGIMELAGGDLRWAHDAHAAMREVGLADVRTVSHAESAVGGGRGSTLYAVNSRQLREPLRAQGLTDDDLARVRELAADPSFAAMWYENVTTVGRKAQV